MVWHELANRGVGNEATKGCVSNSGVSNAICANWSVRQKHFGFLENMQPLRQRGSLARYDSGNPACCHGRSKISVKASEYPVNISARD